MSGINLTSITKDYGDTPVLKGIDLDIRDGEFLALVGPSGCGKSTLLRIIAGLEDQTSGDVQIGARAVNRVRACKRDLAMVFQSYALYPHLTVRENMHTPLKLRDLGFWERMPILGRFMPGHASKMQALTSAVEETAQTLKLEHLLDRKPGQLSGGQRQRVALGRAMVRQPAAFLMDEPLSNLDAALRVHMRAELAELHRSLGTTFVYVTHDQAEALTMSDRLAVMMDGRIIQLGTPDEIYKNPRDRRVAEFIGSPKINLMPGEVDNTGSVVVYGSQQSIRVPPNGVQISVGIRPEHFEVVNDDETGSWPFIVTHKENLGSDFFLHGHLNGSEQRVIARVTPEQVTKISVDTTIRLRAMSDKTMVFDEHGRRVDLLAG